ncbi:MAG: transporter substrate-binding domain-containing protein [Clostridia bacterium]|nr:transporter substrate-binding domain-containing protein [Clostridia bacterium]
MKKIIALILCLVMVLSFTVLFASCGEQKAKVKVYTEYELTAESYAFAVAKENTDLKEAANELLTDLGTSGKLDDIINSFYDGSSTFSYENPVHTVPSGDDRENYLIVATHASFPPFENNEGKKFFGIDMNIAYLLAEKLGKTLYINNMDFDAVIASVKNGESDIGMSGITINEARLELVDFTTEYYESAQVLITREDDSVFADCKSAEDVERALKKQGKDFIVGVQKGTTGFMYTAGDGDGYEGFENVATKPYSTGSLAVLDLANGKINAVIIDKQPAILFAKTANE